MSWRQHVGDNNTGGRLVVNTATVSFLMRVGCMERRMQVLKVKEENCPKEKTKKAAVCVGSRCGW